MFKTTKIQYNTDAPIGGLASALASHGVRTEEGNSAELPNVHIEPKVGSQESPESLPPAESAIPVTNESEPKTPTVQTEGQGEEVKPTTDTKVVPAQEPPKPLSLQEVLKGHQPESVLKELGFDEGTISFAKEYATLPKEVQGFLQHWKSKGDVKEYLTQLTTDYSKMQPEDVMRHQLQSANPDMSPEDLEYLYQAKVINRYKLDPDLYSEDEVKIGRIELLADVRPMRQALAEEQKKFLLPQAPEQTNEPDPQVQSQQAIENLVSDIKQSAPFKKIAESGNKLFLGEGDERFGFPVEPDAIVDILYNPNSFADAMLEIKKGANGEDVISPKDVESQMVVGAIMKYGKKFLNEYANHFKALGALSAVAPIDNVIPPKTGTPTPSQSEPTTLAGKMAAQGRRVTQNS